MCSLRKNVHQIKTIRSFKIFTKLQPRHVSTTGETLSNLSPIQNLQWRRGGPMRPVRVRALAWDTALCSWARHLTLTVPLSTQEYKWVPENCWGKPNKLRGNDLRWTSILSRGSRNTPSRFMLQKPGISSGAMSQSALKLGFFYKTYSYILLVITF